MNKQPVLQALMSLALLCVAAAPSAQERLAAPGEQPSTRSGPAPAAPAAGTQLTRAPANGPAAPEPMPSPKVDLVQEAIDQAAPLSPEEIRELRRQIFQRRSAATENVTGRPPAKQVTSRYELDLSPGATPPVIRVSPSQGAVVTFEDVNGKPWTRGAADNFGDKNGIGVSSFSDHGISVSALDATSMGNIAVNLQGLPTPVVFTVVAGQATTDYWVQMVVPRHLGGSPPQIIETALPAFKKAELSNYLLRTPPEGAKRLAVDGLPGAMAWETSPGMMVLRTNALVTSPITARLPSSDGMSAYEMAVTPSVMVSVNGRMVAAKISGYTIGATGGKQ